MFDWIKRVWDWIVVELMALFCLIFLSIAFSISLFIAYFSFIYINLLSWVICSYLAFLSLPFACGAYKYLEDHDRKEAVQKVRNVFLFELIIGVVIVLIVIIRGDFKKRKILPQKAWICNSRLLNNDLLKSSDSPLDESRTIDFDFAVLDSILDFTPMESTRLYKDNYLEKPFLTEFFLKKMVPLYCKLDYYQLRDINDVLKSTPIEEKIDSVVNAKKVVLFANIEKEIEVNRNLQVSFLSDTLSSILQYELDSLIFNRIDSIQNEYSGGFLDSRKFSFLVGNGSAYFEKLWYNQMRKDSLVNTVVIRNYLDIYVRQLVKSRNDYFREWVPSYCCDLEIDNEHLFYLYPLDSDQIELVKDYTSGERGILIRDLSTNILTGGTGLLLTGGIVVSDIIENWNSKTPEELLCTLLAQNALINLKMEMIKQSMYLNDMLLKEDQILFEKIKECL